VRGIAHVGAVESIAIVLVQTAAVTFIARELLVGHRTFVLVSEMPLQLGNALGELLLLGCFKIGNVHVLVFLAWR